MVEGISIDDLPKPPGRTHSVDIHDQDSIAAFVKRRRERQAAYTKFREAFTNGYRNALSIKVTNEAGGEDTIEVHGDLEKPQIATIELDKENPVRFERTKYKVKFYRWEAEPSKQIKTDTDPFDFQIDWAALNENAGFSAYKSTESENPPNQDKKAKQEAMLADLQRKFDDLLLPKIPIATYARKMVAESTEFKKATALEQAAVILPYYREKEIKRLLALDKLHDDPTTPGYLELATQRQHLYNQLIHLLREADMNPSQITEYMMQGLFDAGRVAGVPTFRDEKGDTYVVVDYVFSGFDEENPKGTDFSGGYTARSETEIDAIFYRAQEHGYATRYYNEYVSGGTHQLLQWRGIRIDDYDRKYKEKNVAKVVKILNDVGINPEEAADPRDTDIEDLFIQNIDT